MTEVEEHNIIHLFFLYARESYNILPGITNHHDYYTLTDSDEREIFIRMITRPLPTNPIKAHFYTCTDWLLYKKEIVNSRLMHFFGKSKKLHGRDCEVQRIDARMAGDFLRKNHLHGPLTGKYKYGLFHKAHGLVGVATFAQARNFVSDDKRIVSSEMLALSFSLGISISGGFQKLLQAHIRDRKPDEIMTYSDLDLGKENIYSRSGFLSKGITPPQPFTLDKEGNRIFHDLTVSPNRTVYSNSGFEKWVLRF